MTSVVTVTPAGVAIEVEPGETLFCAARRQGYLWPTLCDGVGTCRTCYVMVRDGVQNCTAIAEFEREGIEALGRSADGRTRLACQLQVDGPVVVHRRGVRREKDEE